MQAQTVVRNLPANGTVLNSPEDKAAARAFITSGNAKEFAKYLIDNSLMPAYAEPHFNVQSTSLVVPQVTLVSVFFFTFSGRARMFYVEALELQPLVIEL